MCLELLLELADAGEAGGPLADLGTGSGVLAIAAAKLGWGPVLGCDSEVAALEAAGENARANGTELELKRVNLRLSAPPAAPTIVANLTAPLLREVAAMLAERPRTLVCSGLLATEIDEVRHAFEQAGLEPTGERRRGDWAALALRAVSDGPRG
jgi:ribosomal protein L11 methyltransferase